VAAYGIDWLNVNLVETGASTLATAFTAACNSRHQVGVQLVALACLIRQVKLSKSCVPRNFKPFKAGVRGQHVPLSLAFAKSNKF
jgi:hypothetical protein